MSLDQGLRSTCYQGHPTALMSCMRQMTFPGRGMFLTYA